MQCRIDYRVGARPSASSAEVWIEGAMLTSTLLNAKIMNGTPYSLVDLTDTRTLAAIVSP